MTLRIRSNVKTLLPATIKKTFVISGILDRALKLQAVMENKTASQIVEEALENYIKKEYIDKVRCQIPSILLNDENEDPIK
ncbi:hypothetical protein ABG79_01948 [Caloramator mitchellensis]|uniref:Ribbon-helix-helix protein CopG domain-containing protein n=1 Tax=Caloramator mitchellensis TaxID=908809 RepID=A0A0R3JT89_CALMK|nr:hypothetical protein [Caloramator mitchellensis]KRQ86218.1 hypothetical protein ABG79_01948 [Caloramator mitchellensis]